MTLAGVSVGVGVGVAVGMGVAVAVGVAVAADVGVAVGAAQIGSAISRISSLPKAARRDAGIQPWMLLWGMLRSGALPMSAKYLRVGMSPNSSGISLCSQFHLRSKVSRLERLPNCAGMLARQFIEVEMQMLELGEVAQLRGYAAGKA